MKIMITGANGFVGSHLAEQLKKFNVDILATDLSFDKINNRIQKMKNDIQLVELDLLDIKKVKKCLLNNMPDQIINCAAYGVDYSQQDSIMSIKVNVEAPMMLMEISKEIGIKNIMQISSACEYGNNAAPISETSKIQPIGIYGVSKAAGSLFLNERARSIGINLKIIRPFGMWGPGEGNHKLFPQIINSIVNKKALNMTKGEQIRDYVYIKDMAKWIAELALKTLQESPFIINLGSGKPHSLKMLSLMIAQELKGEEFLHFGAIPYRKNEMMSLVADISKQINILGQPILTPVSIGVKEMIEEGV